MNKILFASIREDISNLSRIADPDESRPLYLALAELENFIEHGDVTETEAWFLLLRIELQIMEARLSQR